MTLRFLLPEDCEEVTDLLTLSFGRPDEAELLERLRDSGDMRLELIWLEKRAIRGHIGFARMDAPAGWWALAPLCVHPRNRRRGVAGDLIRYGLDHARQNRAKAVVVLGDPAYYRRFGFSAKAAENLSTPFSIAHTLLYPIRPGMAGVTADLTYPAAFLHG